MIQMDLSENRTQFRFTCSYKSTQTVRPGFWRLSHICWRLLETNSWWLSYWILCDCKENLVAFHRKRELVQCGIASAIQSECPSQEQRKDLENRHNERKCSKLCLNLLCVLWEKQHSVPKINWWLLLSLIVLKKERKKFVLLEVLAGVSITNYCIIKLHHVECK